MTPSPSQSLDTKQSPIRFSLLTMLGLLSLIALYCAALRFSTGFWAMVANSLTIVILAVALVWQFTSAVADRKFWSGFQIAGWSYLVLTFGPQLSHASLLPSDLLSYLQFYMPLSSADAVAIEWHGTWYPGSIIDSDSLQYRIHYSGYGPEWDEWIGPNRIRATGYDEFLNTGNSFLTLIFAVIGGILAKRSWRVGVIMKSIVVGIVIVWILGAVALVYPKDIWASSLFTLSMGFLVAATIGAVTSGPPRNSFLIGFALFGWCYFLFHFSGLTRVVDGSNLVTTLIVETAQDWLHPQAPTPVRSIYMSPPYNPQYFSYPGGGPTTGFQVIGHSLMLILASLIGGLIGWWFSTRKKSVATASASS